MYKTVKTFTATIYVGTCKRGSSDEHAIFRDLHRIRTVCQEYCNEEGLCVTVTPMDFIYTNGCEPGAAIGLINYPRFPSEPHAIRGMALTLAARLRSELRQQKVSIVFPDETVMLYDDDESPTAGDAAGVCESSAVTCDEQEQVASPEFNRAYWKGVAKGFRQAANNMRAAADATGKDGAKC